MLSSSTLSKPKPVRVLLVDDNEAMLNRVAAVLTPGCEVVGAVKDGPSAIRAVETLQPEVIVLDISMPGMTGLEVASRLRASGSTAAVVFLTVHDDEEFLLAAKAAGGTGYVIKRRLGTDLLHAVQEAQAGRSFTSAIQ